MIPELRVVVRLRVTPEDLRKLADQEEEKWKATRVGQPTLFATHYGHDCVVEFLFDQDRMQLE